MFVQILFRASKYGLLVILRRKPPLKAPVFIAPIYIYARFSLLPIMRCPRLRVDTGTPSRREKARKVDYTREIASFYTTRYIRANLPLNAALRAILTFNMFFVQIYLHMCGYAGLERKKRFISIIFGQIELYHIRATHIIHVEYFFSIKTFALNIALNCNNEPY